MIIDENRVKKGKQAILDLGLMTDRGILVINHHIAEMRWEVIAASDIETDRSFPPDAEEHKLSDFISYEYGSSRLLPGRLVAHERFLCPACTADAATPQHGIAGGCQKCTLRWISFGNSLHLWREDAMNQSIESKKAEMSNGRDTLKYSLQCDMQEGKWTPVARFDCADDQFRFIQFLKKIHPNIRILSGVEAPEDQRGRS